MMDNEDVIELLTNYKSYKYALRHVEKYDTGLSLMRATWLRGDRWDGTRYARIVGMIEGAVNELLTDNQRMVIYRKYLDRDNATLTQIAVEKHLHPSGPSRWHREALKTLSIALVPLTYEEREIHNLDHVKKTA